MATGTASALAPKGRGFVRDAWYVAAWADELHADQPLARTLLGDPVVLYRDAEGRPVALEDRCPHRSVPLSIGRVRGNVIECGYHGLQFDATGACVRIPGQSAIPARACVRSYPVQERDGCIWVWTGEAERADPARITAFPWLVRPGWQRTRLATRLECHYQLVIDNLLDLSHLSFVHASTVGSPELADRAEVRAEAIDGGVRVSRWTLNVEPARTYAQIGHFDGPVDRWQISDFRAPGTFVIRNGAAVAGTGAPQGGPGQRRWEFIVCHGITPETERSTNYFWAVNHEFGADDPDATAEFHRQSHVVIQEDIAVFRAQQREIDARPNAPLVDIRYDAGPTLARRLIDRLIAAERVSAPSNLEPVET